MAKIHALKRRIKSVQSIHQITKAMELVSASKLRRAQEAAVRSRIYSTSAREALRALEVAGAAVTHPLFAKREVAHHTLILFTSDRGLAGAYNTNLFKAVIDILARGKGHTFDAIVIGQKGAQFLNKLREQVTTEAVYTNWPTQPAAHDVRPIAKLVVERFTNGTTDKVTLVYTDFVSLAKQQAISRTLLPLIPEAAEEKQLKDDMLFEPSPAVVLEYVLPRLIELQLYQASLEAAASEHGMRMLAMKNASDNAEDVTQDLTLVYNGARQGAITQELAEITSGAEAISS